MGSISPKHHKKWITDLTIQRLGGQTKLSPLNQIRSDLLTNYANFLAGLNRHEK
jgi:hypothetical protein